MANAVGLRIGELAELAGVTTRTIRHYHHVGLLPEPGRNGSGYRVYDLPDVVRLLRTRRLIQLGMGLDEVADALADDQGRELREILVDLRDELLAHEQRIIDRRRMIDELLARDADPTASADQERVLRELEATAGSDHPGLRRERLIGVLLEHVSESSLAPQAWETYSRVLADPALSEAMLAASRRFEELTGLDPADPAVAGEAGDFAAAVAALLPEELRQQPGDPDTGDRLLRAVTAGMDPAQARCVRLMFARWREQSS